MLTYMFMVLYTYMFMVICLCKLCAMQISSMLLLPLQGQTTKESVVVEKAVTKKLEMTEKVMTALKEKGEVDSDLGIVLPKEEDATDAKKVKAEKPSLDKLQAAMKILKSAYLFSQALHQRPAC